jgi:hypothetical protein
MATRIQKDLVLAFVILAVWVLAALVQDLLDISQDHPRS